MLIFFVVLLIIVFIFLLLRCTRIVKEWERLPILTFGRFTGIKGPGIVILIPVIQTIANIIDMRVVTSKFNTETTLTKDGVSITVQAVLFWRVVDAKLATLAVSNYRDAIEVSAQTTLRDVIGKLTLANILSNLHELDNSLKENIGRKTTSWGIEVCSVEIRDVSIPQSLQEVMSRAAQAEREKQARIIYGEAEIEAAKKFVEASNIYSSTPNALQLRAMSIMYEAVKSDNNTIIIVPSQLSDSFSSTTALTTALNSKLNKDVSGKVCLEKE